MLCNMEASSQNCSTPIESLESDFSHLHSPNPKLTSSYVLSTRTSESDNIGSKEDDLLKTSFYNGEFLNRHNDMCMVFVEHLNKVFVRCLYNLQCTVPISIIRHTFNSLMITVQTICNNHHKYSWRSQPVVNKFALDNVMLSAAILFTGNRFHTISEIAEVSCIKLFYERTFYEIQNKHLFPTVNNM